MELLRTVRHFLFVAGLTLAGMCAAILAVNLIPNDRLLTNVGSSTSLTNFQPSQFGFGQVDFWDECIAATLGLGHGADQLSWVKRSFLSPVIGNCKEFQKYKNGELWVPFNELSEESAPPTNLGFNYWRYWHGYQILSRPFLYRFSLYRLHYVLFALFVVSGVFFVAQVSRFSSTCSWSLVIASLCVPLVDQVTIVTQSLVWILAFSFSGWLLLPSTSTARRPHHPYVWFMVTGMLCCFFDLLTVPLVTLTVPLVALYWKGEFDGGSPKLTIRRIFMLSAIWLAGYSVCWAAKWAIVALIGGTGVITELSKIIQHRLGIGGGALGDGGQDLSVSAARSILSNIRVCRYGLLIVTGILIVRIRPLMARIRPWAARLSKGSLSAVAVPLLICGMPIAWLAVMQQHSILLSWFVARIYFGSFAIVLAFFLAPGPRETEGDYIAGRRQ
jgi:hypothetical protein